MAGGDAKKLARLNRFASPVNLFKSWEAGQQKIGAGDILRAKPDGTPENGGPEAVNEWRAAAGIPAEPAGYLENMPKGIVFGEADQKRVESFITAMHGDDAPPAYVHKALGWYHQLQQDQAAEAHQKDVNFRAESEDTMRAEWGPDYTPYINNMNALLVTHGGEELVTKFFGARTPDGRMFGDDPAVLKFLAGVAKELNPFGTITPSDGANAMETITAELDSLNAEMKDTKSTDPKSYWKNEAKQARYRQLLEMQSRHQKRGG